jgi:ubiquinone/menaquinone biosynthesis C-methylase UbiE
VSSVVTVRMKRIVTAELLDTDSGTPAEVANSLADLRRINLWFGGIATTQAMIEDVAYKLNAKSLSLLEVAAGSGDVPRVAAERLKARGIKLEITLLDRAASHLKGAAANNGRSEIRAVVGDAIALPFPDNSFDLVDCGLFTHHLAPEQVVQFVNEGLRVCRRAVLINDLVRHLLHLTFVYAGFPFYRSRLTRNDAPASVRQAYTVEEMRALVKRTRAAKTDISLHYLFRMGVIAWK